MINLTKFRQFLRLRVDPAPFIMNFGKIGSGVVLGLTLAAALINPEGVTAQDKKLLAVMPENPTVAAIVANYKRCVDEAAAVTTPEMIPDPVICRMGFDAIVEECDGIKDAQLKGLELDARMEARTNAIIAGAKKEIGLES